MSVKLRSKKNQNGSQSLYLDIYYRGKRRYEFLQIKIEKNDKLKKQKKELAEKKRSQRELEIFANANKLPNYYDGENDFLDYFEKYCTVKSYKSAKNKLKEFAKSELVNGILPFNRIDEKFCEDYKEWLQSKVSNNTTCVYVLKLKTVLNKAVKERLIPYNPAKFVSVKPEETEKIHLTLDELKKLYKTDCKNNVLKRAFLFACYTGLRLSDIKNLTWGQIREGRLYFRQKKTRGVEYLPINETALKILYSDMQANVIPLPDVKVFDIKVKRSENIGYQLRQWAEKAEVKKYITFHSARHTFATISLTAGVDLYTVSKMLGHKSINTTQIYAKIVDEKVNEAIKKLPQLS